LPFVVVLQRDLTVQKEDLVSNADPPALSPADEREEQVKIISHSDLFYWWPVWVVGYLMAALTYWDGHLMAIVPNGTVAEKARQVQGHEGPRGAGDGTSDPSPRAGPVCLGLLSVLSGRSWEEERGPRRGGP
jgi:hypothetical protein